MRTTPCKIKNLDEFMKKIFPLLKWEIFHITSFENYKKILKDWYIKSWLQTQRPNSYFYKQSCVCLFDARPESTKKWDTIEKTFDRWRNGYIKPKWKIVALILNPKEYKNIIKAPKNAGSVWLIIPYIEVWYKEKVSIDKIYKTYIVEYKKNIKKHKDWYLIDIHNEASKKEKYIEDDLY